jgi:hypothetical protein
LRVASNPGCSIGPCGFQIHHLGIQDVVVSRLGMWAFTLRILIRRNCTGGQPCLPGRRICSCAHSTGPIDVGVKWSRSRSHSRVERFHCPNRLATCPLLADPALQHMFPESNSAASHPSGSNVSMERCGIGRARNRQLAKSVKPNAPLWPLVEVVDRNPWARCSGARCGMRRSGAANTFDSGKFAAPLGEIGADPTGIFRALTSRIRIAKIGESAKAVAVEFACLPTRLPRQYTV